MKENNGWISVYDTEHRPHSGERVLCMGMLDEAVEESEPLADPNNRMYYIAEWFNAGDTMCEEITEPDEGLSPDERLAQMFFGKERKAPKDGFYTKEPEIYKRKDTRGGTLPSHSMVFRYHRLLLSGEGMDGLICWKPLDYPVNI